MIITDIEGFSRYAGLNPAFPKLIEYLRTHDLLSAELGRIVLDGDNLFINNVELDGIPADRQVLEMHRKYIDVHILLRGAEAIGWKPLSEISNITEEYSEEKDCAISDDAPTAMAILQPGDLCIVFPEDPHAPTIGSGKIRKAIAKIKV